MRERLVKAPENRVDAGVRITAARRHVAGFAARFLERRMGDCGTNCVGVRVIVPDDVGLRRCAGRLGLVMLGLLEMNGLTVVPWVWVLGKKATLPPRKAMKPPVSL